MITGQPSLFFGSLNPTASVASLSLNSSTLWGLYSFIATESSITALYVSLGAVTGTNGNIKITFALQAENTSGKLGGSDLFSTEVTGGWTASALNTVSVNWTGLTVNARYWIIVKNTSVAPTVDYPAIQNAFTSQFDVYGGSTSGVVGVSKVQTTDGATFASVVSGSSAIACKFASGRVNLLPRDGTSTSDVSTLIYSGRKAGVVFTTPDNLFFRVASMSHYLRGNGGTPTGTITGEIWINGVLAKTSTLNPQPGGFVSGQSGTVIFPFENLIIPPKSLVYAVVGLSGGDSGGNCIYINSRVTLPNDAALKAAKPCNGTMSKIYYNGTGWTITDTQYYSCLIAGDVANPVAAPPLNRRRFFNQR